jgi:hypothetical protein
MKFEKLNASMFQQISFDEMAIIHGGVGGSTNLTGIHTTTGKGMDSDDADCAES